ncbi:ABC transporter ATP-binding protein [Xylanibacillus composti]|uniref:ABC transporter domain-containing protein n=1 Tax=Xylanibacillus composti TaxID=1572762 RepID=A0A8J4H3D5_9BACL|nr:ABC transporter ATP-binding protein [Xylanibacillus composti]GIQ67848.1 hypothetical protein XYCOK13_06720 [Xylanibacillus composti]
MHNEALLELSQATKTIGDYQLGPINLRLEPGTITAVVGPNGAGKSTLFKLMMNMAQPDSGTVHLFGGSYEEDEVKLKQRIAYVPETFYHPDDGMTVRMETSFVKRWYPRWNEALYQELAAKYELPLDKKLKDCSKGTLRRMELVHALAAEADVLLLDEPSSGLDPFVWRDWIDDLRRWMEQGERSIVIATHMMEEVKRLADYIAILHRGELLDIYEKDALQDGWRKLWLDGPLPVNNLPGVMHVQHEPAPMVVTSDQAAIEEVLQSLGIRVRQRQALELDEIFSYMIRKKDRR